MDKSSQVIYWILTQIQELELTVCKVGFLTHLHFKTHSLNDQYFSAVSSFSQNTRKSLMTLHWIWEPAWGTLWRARHSCSVRGNQVSLLRRGQQVLFYSYGSVFQQEDSCRNTVELLAESLTTMCCDSYRNRSSTPSLCLWLLSSHWHQLPPDFVFSPPLCMCLSFQNCRGFPGQPHGLFGSLLSFSPWKL